MSEKEAFEKWLRDWSSRNPCGELQPSTVWYVACRWATEQATQSGTDAAQESETLRPALTDEQILDLWDKCAEKTNGTLSFSVMLCAFSRALLAAQQPPGEGK